MRCPTEMGDAHNQTGGARPAPTPGSSSEGLLKDYHRIGVRSSHASERQPTRNRSSLDRCGPSIRAVTTLRRNALVAPQRPSTTASSSCRAHACTGCRNDEQIIVRLTKSDQVRRCADEQPIYREMREGGQGVWVRCRATASRIEKRMPTKLRAGSPRSQVTFAIGVSQRK